MSDCHQIHEVYHDYRGQRAVHYHGRRGQGRWDRWDHHHFRHQQKADEMCWDLECIGRQTSCTSMEYGVRIGSRDAAVGVA
jgi:hypothetical protein